MSGYHKLNKGRPPGMTTAGEKQTDTVVNRRSKYTAPRLDIDPISGDPVVTVRNVQQTIAEILGEFAKGISPPRIAVRLQIPLSSVLATLKSQGKDVSAYDLRAIESYRVWL